MGLDEAKTSGRSTMQQMIALPGADPLYGTAFVRADGKRLNPDRACKTKFSAGSKGEWDQFKLLATSPRNNTSQPMDMPDRMLADT